MCPNTSNKCIMMQPTGNDAHDTMTLCCAQSCSTSSSVETLRWKMLFTLEVLLGWGNRQWFWVTAMYCFVLQKNTIVTEKILHFTLACCITHLVLYNNSYYKHILATHRLLYLWYMPDGNVNGRITNRIQCRNLDFTKVINDCLIVKWERGLCAHYRCIQHRHR